MSQLTAGQAYKHPIYHTRVMKLISFVLLSRRKSVVGFSLSDIEMTCGLGSNVRSINAGPKAEHVYSDMTDTLIAVVVAKRAVITGVT